MVNDLHQFRRARLVALAKSAESGARERLPAADDEDRSPSTIFIAPRLASGVARRQPRQMMKIEHGEGSSSF